MTHKDVRRFLAKYEVDTETGCWNWTAGKNSWGYGTFWLNGRNERAHRFSYEALIGTIPGGLHIDHLCRNRKCVNPAHMEPVTLQENTRRGESGWKQAAKSHCPKGHPYAGSNLYLHVQPSGPRRHCRTCRNEAREASRKRVAA
jgi:hypothetical protein